MKVEEFNELLAHILADCSNVLAGKATEYATDFDRLHNFKYAALVEKTIPEQALRGFLTKHVVSVYDMIDGLKQGKDYPLSLWREKLGDIRNYTILLEALVTERDGQSRLK